MDTDEPYDKWHHGRTILQQAKDEGVSRFKVQTNEKFAQGVDAIRTVSPDFAEKILKPDQDSLKIAKGVVAAIPALKYLKIMATRVQNTYKQIR